MSRGGRSIAAGLAFDGRKSVIAAALIVIATLAAVLAGAGTRSAFASVDGNECRTYLTIAADSEDNGLKLVQESTWHTDFWATRPPPSVRPRQVPGYWASEGGLFRGCHFDVKYDVICNIGLCLTDRLGRDIPLGTIEISETMPWRGSPSSHCLIRSIGDYRFPRSHCIHFHRDDLQRGYLGARSLTEYFHLELGPLCIQHISPERISICL